MKKNTLYVVLAFILAILAVAFLFPKQGQDGSMPSSGIVDETPAEAMESPEEDAMAPAPAPAMENMGDAVEGAAEDVRQAVEDAAEAVEEDGVPSGTEVGGDAEPATGESTTPPPAE